LKLLPHFLVLHFPPQNFWSRISSSAFQLLSAAFSYNLEIWSSFSSRVGRSLIHMAPHWSFIFRSCIFSQPDSLGYICVAEGMVLFSTTLTQLAPKSTEFGKITQNNGQYAVRGHSSTNGKPVCD